MTEWKPIDTATAIAGKDAANGKPVLVAHAPTGKIKMGVVCDFTGDDGIVRRGVGAALGIFMATHWMPLPAPPELLPVPANPTVKWIGDVRSEGDN